MKKLIKVLFLVLFLSALRYPLSATYAAVPHLINYQGRLTDTTGQPLKGLYNITFRIYDAETAGNLIWQGTYNGTSISKGIFNILLGDISDTGFNFANLVFDKPYWLEIKVGTDVPMQPRQRITSAAYAIMAERLVDEPLPAARGGTGSTAAANTANGVVVLDANRKLPAVDGSQLTNIPMIPNGMQAFTSSGTWTKPSGVTKVYVKVWGAGGGCGSTGYGGSGGGYSEGLIAVTGNVTVTVGVGGTIDQPGGNSSFAGSTTISATGGRSGLASGGTGSGGSINLTGGSSDMYTAGDSAFGGGWGGKGHFPGGGGRPDNGANGLVIVYW